MRLLEDDWKSVNEWYISPLSTWGLDPATPHKQLDGEVGNMDEDDNERDEGKEEEPDNEREERGEKEEEEEKDESEDKDETEEN